MREKKTLLEFLRTLGIWKEALVVYYEILPRSKAEKTEGNQAADSEYPVTCPQYTPITSQLQVHSLVAVLTWLCIMK